MDGKVRKLASPSSHLEPAQSKKSRPVQEQVGFKLKNVEMRGVEPRSETANQQISTCLVAN